MESVGCLYDILLYAALSQVSLDWLLSAKIPAARSNLFFLNFLKQDSAFFCLVKSWSLHFRVVFSSVAVKLRTRSDDYSELPGKLLVCFRQKYSGSSSALPTELYWQRLPILQLPLLHSLEDVLK